MTLYPVWALTFSLLLWAFIFAAFGMWRWAGFAAAPMVVLIAIQFIKKG